MTAPSGHAAGARVTIAVIPRERFSYAIPSLQSILDSTPQSTPIVYIDGRSPPEVSRFVRERAQARGFRYVRLERYLGQNEARNIALEHIETEFVAFVDNDIYVHPGWLETLLRCADETGAWIVGPLYLEGSGNVQRVHMAGGLARIETEDGRRFCVERHYHAHKNPAEPSVRSLGRSATELVEFHCMLVRREVFRRLGRLDERLLSLHEHVDFCLNVRAAGGSIWIEPGAVVRYSFEGKLRMSDLPFIALRWGQRWNATTMAAFHHKWRLSADDPCVAQMLRVGNHHRRMVLGQFLPRWLRRPPLSYGAIWVIENLAGIVGRVRYGKGLADGAGAMHPPADPTPVLVSRWPRTT